MVYIWDTAIIILIIEMLMLWSGFWASFIWLWGLVRKHWSVESWQQFIWRYWLPGGVIGFAKIQRLWMNAIHKQKDDRERCRKQVWAEYIGLITASSSSRRWVTNLLAVTPGNWSALATVTSQSPCAVRLTLSAQRQRQTLTHTHTPTKHLC